MIVMLFGCFGRTGHYLQTNSVTREQAYYLPQVVDCIGHHGYSKPLEETQPEGGTWLQSGTIHETGDTFTALQWWDRQGDSRGASHTCLIAWGEHTAETLLTDGREQHPRAFRVPVRLDIYAPPAVRSGPGWSVGPCLR